jgi:aspartyl protease family protein
MADGEGPWGGQSTPPPKEKPKPKPRSAVWMLLVVLAGFALGVMALSAAFPGRVSEWKDWDPVLRSGAVLAIVATSLFARRLPLAHVVKSGLVWAGIAGVLLLGYAYRDVALDAWLRVRAAVVPGYAVATAAREMVLNRDENGAFYAVGQVNGQPVAFLIDTGASDIVLSPADARRLGVDLDALTFDSPYETANGEGKGAAYRVRSLSLGDIHLSDVDVSINQAPMRTSLLGMAFFKRLKGFRIEGDRLILTWR